jgi:hypothetical protein
MHESCKKTHIIKHKSSIYTAAPVVINIANKDLAEANFLCAKNGRKTSPKSVCSHLRYCTAVRMGSNAYVCMYVCMLCMLCMYVCYVCYVCMYVCMCEHGRMQSDTHARAERVLVSREAVNSCTYACMHRYVDAHMHPYIDAYLHITDEALHACM